MRKIISILLVVTLVLCISIPAVAAGIEKRAIASSTKFIMDGKEVTFDSAYLIEDSNYIQLRSVAQMLNGTASQFNVYWDDILNQAVIETGKPYTGVKDVVVEKDIYKIGDNVTIKNTEITITDVFTAKNVNEFTHDGTDETFFGVTFTILTSNPYLRGRHSHGTMDFMKSCDGESGVSYRNHGIGGQPESTLDIYQNQETTMTIYYQIPDTEQIVTITVSDGQGNIQKISVN